MSEIEKPNKLPTLHGRGATDNPKNRFEKIEVVFDPKDNHLEFVTEFPKPTTQFFHDHAKSIISYNDSPDIGMSASLNAYRGCEHGCSYCLDGNTRILMADSSHKALKDIRVGDQIIGVKKQGHYLTYLSTPVLAHWQTLKPAYEICLADGTKIIASGDHRFLTERGWKHVVNSKPNRPYLTTNNHLLGVGSFEKSPKIDAGYRRGYLTGMIRGDGLLKSFFYQRQGRKHGNQHHFRLVLMDNEALGRTQEFLEFFGIKTQRFQFSPASKNRTPLFGIRNHSQKAILRIQKLIDWPSTGNSQQSQWSKGFLAGIFDAEGSYSQGILRIANTNQEIIHHVCMALKSNGFQYRLELQQRKKDIYYIRLLGGLQEHLKFFHLVFPSIKRKNNILGQKLKHKSNLQVTAIRNLNKTIAMYDISTGTENFIANGVVSHNCYARQTHEYLGFGAGIDFETKIMVKLDAPALLRKELSKKSWQPQALMMSGVTDIYQPAERKFKLTRTLLKVLLEFRNPAGLITKNALVLRDLDVLTEMAKLNLVSVALSITTLDNELQSCLEPRTSTPARRLQAVEQLAKAGVPVGVMTAPIIPGLNDHEIPALVQAAKDAGAHWAGYTMLHLPYSVKDVFVDWVERHYPDRGNKILGRIREMRGGLLNDPRFGKRMRGEGEYAEQVRQLHASACRKAKFPEQRFKLSTEHFRVPRDQESLF